jgi:asparagine synthase (glutamine-hydrolysing)
VCGICGASHDARGVGVAAMCGRMVHRGPDDEGSHVDPASGFALGARRLSVIDVAGGHQPVSNEDGSIWAVLNGEIYNHPALQDQLRRRGHALASRTDTEVLVHLYEDFGDRLVDALDGMYAFAIWDARRQRLLIARDRFGEKPLFYREVGRQVSFASELTALAAGTVDQLRISPQAVSDFFLLGYVGGESSIADGVSQLPPGHLLTWSVDDPTVRTQRYWSSPHPPPDDERSRGDLAAELELLLRQAVRSRLVADVPVGVFLSGGLDSTLVTAMAAREHTGKLQTFTVSYDVGRVNENDAAQVTAHDLGTEHAEIVLDAREIEHRVPAVLGALDQPNADPALIALNAVAELARPSITVALGGEGADELFGGYPRYRGLELASVIRRALPAPVAARLSSQWEKSVRGRSRRAAHLLDPRELVENHLDWVTSGRRSLRTAVLGQRLAMTDSLRPLADARAIVEEHGREGVAWRFMELDRSSWLPDDVLAKADRATMLCSLEMRTPFLEQRLAEFAISIPGRRHVWPVGKALLRDVYHSLTGSRKTPPKTAFRVPAGEWLRGPLRAGLEHHATNGRLVSEDWFDSAALSALISEHIAGADHSAVLWPALALGCWLEGSARQFAAP